MGTFNNIDKDNWREYTEIAPSVWQFDRDTDSYKSKKDFHGAFVYQVARNLIQRYTKPHDWVLDMFGGSMTTTRAAHALSRNSVATDIAYEELKQVKMDLKKETAHYKIRKSAAHTRYLHDIEEIRNRKIRFGLTILHPPYYDVIRFSDLGNDLSTFTSPHSFREAMKQVYKNAYKWTRDGGFIALVFGDVYRQGQLLPAFEVANVFNELYPDGEVILKAIYIKNIAGNEHGSGGKAKGLWTYRSLMGGFAVFSHEYLFTWRKVE